MWAAVLSCGHGTAAPIEPFWELDARTRGSMYARGGSGAGDVGGGVPGEGRRWDLTG
jgi:hypothetical protein